jgi:hypothetical protein
VRARASRQSIIHLSVIRHACLLHRAATSASKDGHPFVHPLLTVSARGAACLLSFAATSLWPLTNCKKLQAGFSSEGPLVELLSDDPELAHHDYSGKMLLHIAAEASDCNTFHIDHPKGFQC